MCMLGKPAPAFREITELRNCTLLLVQICQWDNIARMLVKTFLVGHMWSLKVYCMCLPVFSFTKKDATHICLFLWDRMAQVFMNMNSSFSQNQGLGQWCRDSMFQWSNSSKCTCEFLLPCLSKAHQHLYCKCSLGYWQTHAFTL